MKKTNTPIFKKISIIGGAGGVGSTLAFYLGLKDLAAQINLIDVRVNVLATHIIDLRECFSQECSTNVTTGDWGSLADSQVVLMTASRAAGPVTSRDEYLEKNLAIVAEAAKAIKENAPEAMVIVATAPTDVFTLVFQDIWAGDRHRLLGFCRNDSQRFRWALGQVLKVDPRRLDGLVIGEHGQKQVPIYSTVTLDENRYPLTINQKNQTQKILDDWYGHWQAQNSGRTTTWTSATSLYRTLRSLAGQSSETLMGSVVLEGEYGLSGVALGLPLKPGPLGWSEVVELSLTMDEKRLLALSAENVKRIHKSALALQAKNP
ncbi:MAG: hypothetical protein LBT38_12030 [Deltaproteobacteria bacterium]|jgi:malate/lactate dehydrogenase|nr:hypothetical protein [Deltaproteobacteria bacterium]